MICQLERKNLTLFTTASPLNESCQLPLVLETTVNAVETSTPGHLQVLGAAQTEDYLISGSNSYKLYTYIHCVCRVIDDDRQLAIHAQVNSHSQVVLPSLCQSPPPNHRAHSPNIQPLPTHPLHTQPLSFLLLRNFLVVVLAYYYVVA